jgi:drug/metabolite transporter (DMT)-like permease
MTKRGWILFLTLSVLWGIPYFMIRIAVRQLDPATLVFARTFPAAVLLMPLAIQRKVLGTLRNKWGWLLAFSVIEFGIPWFLMGSSERHLSSSLTGLMVASVPLGSITLTKLLHPSERIHARRILGLAVGSVGVVTLVGLDVHGGSLLWIGAMLIVVTGYACGPMILALRLHEASGLAVVASSVSIVALAYLPWGVSHWPAHLKIETWLSVAGLSMLCTVAAFLVFFALIQEVGPSRGTVITYFNTAVAVVLGTLVLHEPLTTGILIGFPLIIVGSVFATSQARSAQARPELSSRSN